jgi:hypothetical protein
MPRSKNKNVFFYWTESLYYPPELEPLLDFCFKYLYEKKQDWHNLYFETHRKNAKFAEKIMQDFFFFQKFCRKIANVEERIVQWQKNKRENPELNYKKYRMLLSGACDSYERKYGKLNFMRLCTKRETING